MSLAEVIYRDRVAGAVLFEDGRATFEYSPEFIADGPELSPLHLPLAAGPVQPVVPDHFLGLPGLLADSLPDRFGNALIDAWLASKGISRENFNPVDRLCYIGSRGMGALEYRPAKGPPRGRRDRAIRLDDMVEIAGRVLRDRQAFTTDLEPSAERAVKDILSIGTSAGGARAKAVIAWNENTGQIRSGQVDASPGFEQYLLKFDGVDASTDSSPGEPLGYGRAEYAYFLMARAAGITISDSRLLEENGRAHFLTRRFDRDGDRRIHIQTFSAIDHRDFNLPQPWEAAIEAGRRLGLPPADLEEMVLRAAFNATFSNRDDHAKNLSFMLTGDGWRLAPAYDLTWAWNPDGEWTDRHQMTVNAKRDTPTLEDFRALARTTSLRRNLPADAVERVRTAGERWPEFAAQAGLDDWQSDAIRQTFQKIT